MKASLALVLLFSAAPSWAEPAKTPAALPEPVPISRYHEMVERSPFALATAPVVEAPKVEAPSFAKDYYITGIAKMGGQDFVTISSRDKQHRFSLVIGESAEGLTLASVDWSPEVGKSRATLKKGSEFGEITFDEAAMQPAPPPAVPAPATHVQTASATPGHPPATNNPYAALENRRREWAERRGSRHPGNGGNGAPGEWRRRTRPIPTAPQR